MERYHADLATTLGRIGVTVDAQERLLAVRFRVAPHGGGPPAQCKRALRQLTEYFDGKRTRFELDLAQDGTAFQRRVWQALTEIPYGEVVSYGEIARRIGIPGAARAVGQANGANPIPIVVPCHRVIAADGSIGGFASGLGIKRQLMRIERIRLAA